MIFAQTEEIQREIETKLWLQRGWEWLGSVTGMPPWAALLTLLTLILCVGALAWLLRRKRA
jgi:hypothetical protein